MTDLNFEGSGFLFDLDGTLVHSEPSIEKSWEIMARELSISAPKLNDIHGIPAIDTIRKYAPELNQKQLECATKRMEELEIETANLVSPINGAKELTERLTEKGIPWTVVTSGTNPLASARLKAIGLSLPKNSITFELVENGKPHPEPFIKGAAQLELDPSVCWAVEDSQSGLISAQKAGCKTIAILTHYSAEELPGADIYINDLKELITNYF